MDNIVVSHLEDKNLINPSAPNPFGLTQAGLPAGVNSSNPIVF